MAKLLVAMLAVVLAGCGAAGSTSSASKEAKQTHRYVPPPSSATSSSTTSTTRAPAPKGNGVAIARRLGCANPTNDTANQLPVPGIPAAVESVDCTAGGTEFDIEVYSSHAAIEKIESPVARAVLCSVATSFGQSGPQYEVLGDDFLATATSSGADANGDSIKGTLAQAEALGAALKLPVTTVPCS